jgi:hypothetical protein
MKIRRHFESHIVELDDGSTWRIFPGDIDVTLNWRPKADLKLVHIDDQISSHALISSDNRRVRVLPFSENWPVKDVKAVLKDGYVRTGSMHNNPEDDEVVHRRRVMSTPTRKAIAKACSGACRVQRLRVYNGMPASRHASIAFSTASAA